MQKVLVTYARNRICLVAARSLYEAGYEVHAGDSVRSAMTFFSRSVAKKLVYPSPFSQEEKFVEALLEYIRTNNIDILMPTHEEGFIIAKHLGRFRGRVKLLLPKYEAILLANNKKDIEEIAAAAGLPCPQTFSFKNAAEFEIFLAGEHKFPLVIKLQKSRGSAGLTYAKNNDEFAKNYFDVIRKFKIKKELPLVQEFIDGYGLGVSLLYREGKALASFTHKRLIETSPSGGFSIERMSARHPEAERLAKILLDRLDWNGVAMVEFRVDKKTDTPYFLEINPRFWGSLNQAIVAGVNFPKLVCDALVGKEFPAPDYKLGVRTRWFWGGVFFLPKYIFAGRWKDVFTLLNVFDRNLHFDDLSWSDPLPTLAALLLPLANIFTRGKITYEEKDEEVINFNQ